MWASASIGPVSLSALIFNIITSVRQCGDDVTMCWCMWKRVLALRSCGLRLMVFLASHLWTNDAPAHAHLTDAPADEK